MNILTKSILTTLAALAFVSTTHAETFPVFEDAAGTPTTRVIKKAGGTGTTMAVSAKSAAFVNFLVGSSGYSASQVTAARLVVYFPTVTKAGNLNVAVGTSAFQEKLATPSITLASVPTGGFDTIPVDASLKKSFYIVDVTAQVKAWLTNPNSEFGFVITSDGVANCTIGAKEGSGSGYPAVLEVDIAGGSTANGTFLFNGGNVGIGIANPVSRLDVAGGVKSSGTNGFTFNSGDADGGLFSPADGQLTLKTNNADRLFINGTGNVGIGTTAPAAKLHIFGTGIGSPATSGSTQSPGLVARLRDAGNIILDIGGSGGTGFWLQCTQGDNLANNYPLTLNPNGGNVGIGTTAPNASLDVNGGVKATGVNGYTFNSGDEDGGIFSPANGVITVKTENAERLRVDGTGNIGIGTTDPLNLLHLSRDSINGAGVSLTSQTFTSEIQQKSNGASDSALQFTNKTSSAGNGAFEFVNKDSTSLLKIVHDGNVGIGTTTPTQAKLVVAGSNLAPSSYTTEAFLDTAGAFNVSTLGENHQTSIFADAFIRSNQGFIVSSDARTKTVLNISDGAADLAALTQIQITDYQYKDTVSRGLQIQKKVIAQQIEPFCPQAIVKSTDVVPDIYKAASTKDGWVELNTDLKKGDRVRLMGDKTSAIFEVLEVRDGAFRTAFQPAGEKVFVYGREVNDFRTVDYDAIAMLNVSATQELAKQLAAKDATIAALEAKLAAFGDKLAALETANPTRTARSEAPAPQPASVEVK